MKPRIGITMFNGQEGPRRYTKVQRTYVESILAAGGVPVLIPSGPPPEMAQEFLTTLSGIIFTGGEDISPIVYGEDPIKELGVTDIGRDRWEIALYRGAIAKQLAILGICRGVHLMNVAEGGTLYQDVNAQTGTAIGHFPRDIPMETFHHYIDIDDGSNLSRIYGTTRLLVNSFHHQAVKEVAPVFRATAKSADGIVEAIEHVDRPEVLAVQFHAEALPPAGEPYPAIFRHLVAAATAHR